MEGPLLFGQEVLAAEQARRQVRRQDVGPALARVAELGGERGGRMAGGRPKHVEERFAGRARHSGFRGKRPVDLAAYGVVVPRGGHRPRVDERPERGARRVLGGEIEQDEGLEGIGPFRIAPELGREPIEDVVDRLVTDPLVQPLEGRGESARPDVALVAIDEGVSDLVEEAEGDDLSGVGRRCAAAALVQPAGEPASRGDLVDEQLALVTEVAMVEVVPSPR